MVLVIPETRSPMDEGAWPESLDPRSPENHLVQSLEHWREVPLYRSRLTGDRSNFSDLPFITKRDMRNGFPHNFLRDGQALETLLAEAKVELEHTSGTSEERTPVLLGRGWWQMQES